MDLNRRKEALEHLRGFFQTREDALWLLNRIQKMVEDRYPNEQLTQREQMIEYITKDSIWASMRVCCYHSNADFDRRLPGNWATTPTLSCVKSMMLPLKALM